MRYFILLPVLIFLSCNNAEKTVAQTTEDQDVNSSNYGESINETNPASLSEMMTGLEEKDSLFITVKGEITSTCKMKGCWMNIKLPNGEEMRVTFKDYGFFVPKEGMEGKEAIMEGYVTKAVVDEGTRRHFAQDAGKSEEEVNAITGDETKITFVADGVRIYN